MEEVRAVSIVARDQQRNTKRSNAPVQAQRMGSHNYKNGLYGLSHQHISLFAEPEFDGDRGLKQWKKNRHKIAAIAVQILYKQNWAQI